VGALDKNASVGEMHAPTQVIKRAGEIPFHNVALDIATTMPELLRPQMHAGTTVANVRSPVDETIAEVDRIREAGADIVEMELSHLLRALKGSTVSLSALYMVSDVPGTDKTIEKQANGELGASLRRAVDVLIEGLGMRGVVVAPEQQPPAPGGFEGAMVLAERALEKRGIRGEQYGLMRLVVARYLLNGLSDKAIGSLVADDKADALASTRVASRWQEKALRELAQPFTNDDVVQRVRHLGAELKDAVREIQKLGGTADSYKVHILGSLVKGRAAKGSDLDVLIETRDDALRERVFDSPFGWRGKKPDGDVVLGSYEYLTSRGAFYGPTLDIGDGQRFVDDPNALVEVWAKSVAPYGVRVEMGKDGAVRVEVETGALSDVSVARETEAVAERLLEHEKSFRRFVDTDFLLRHLRDVAPLADVADVPLDRLVRSGEVLLRQRLPSSLNRARVLELLATPLGDDKLRAPGGAAFLKAAGLADRDALIERVERSGIAGLPWALFVDGEVACELMRVGDPFYRLCVDVAAADRAKKERTGTVVKGDAPVVFPFFAREVRAAEARERKGGAALLSRLHGRLDHVRASAAAPEHAPHLAPNAALQAIAAAGVSKSVVDSGPARTVGLGITVPIMEPRPSIDVAAYVNEPSKRDLSKVRIAIASDHGAFGRAEKCADILKRMGVGEVVVLAPTVQGEKVPYAVTSHAALSMLEGGSVDRVISFCGNGLGALDVANQHAEHQRSAVKPPIYGDNLWSVVNGSAAGANVLAMGGRLLDVNGDPMAAFLKAFLDEPPSPASGGTSPPAHGVTSRLVDPEPKRIAKRTLTQPIKEAAKLTPDELRRAIASPVAIYFNPDDVSARDQMKTLKQMLAGAGRTTPPNVRFIAWDGAHVPTAAPGERVLLLSDAGCAAVPTRAWGSFQPEQPAVERASYVNGVAAFAREGGAILDLPCASLQDAATGGRQHDLLRLFVKTFLLESNGAQPSPQSQDKDKKKALYGDSVRFTEAMLQGGALPPELASWGDKLAQVVREARRS
jgi:ribose 5-phosphate isomerase RpiB